MPATFVHGKNTVFKIGTQDPNTDGSSEPTTLIDISGWLDSVSYPRTMDTAETTTFGSSARSYIPSFPSNTFSVSGKWDGTASAIDQYLAGLQAVSYAVAVQFRPNGTASPSYDMAGNLSTQGTTNAGIFISSYSVSAPVNDVVSFTADFIGNKAVTRTP